MPATGCTTSSSRISVSPPSAPPPSGLGRGHDDDRGSDGRGDRARRHRRRSCGCRRCGCVVAAACRCRGLSVAAVVARCDCRSLRLPPRLSALRFATVTDRRRHGRRRRPGWPALRAAAARFCSPWFVGRHLSLAGLAVPPAPSLPAPGRGRRAGRAGILAVGRPGRPGSACSTADSGLSLDGLSSAGVGVSSAAAAGCSRRRPSRAHRRDGRLRLAALATGPRLSGASASAGAASVLSRGFGRSRRSAAASAALTLLDGGDEVALAHAGGALMPSSPGQCAQLGEHHAVPARPPVARCARRSWLSRHPSPACRRMRLCSSAAACGSRCRTADRLGAAASRDEVRISHGFPFLPSLAMRRFEGSSRAQRFAELGYVATVACAW